MGGTLIMISLVSRFLSDTELNDTTVAGRAFFLLEEVESDCRN